MDESIQSNNTAIFLSVANYENPHNLVSPEDFRDIILTVLQNGIKKIHLMTFQSSDLSCNNMDMNTCFDSMLLSSLSALDALFQLIAQTNMSSLKSSAKADSANSILNNPIITSPQHQGHSESTIMQIWYRNTAKQFSSSNVAELLVKYLVSGNKITAYLAKKTLLSGVRSQNIEISQVLSLLKQEWNAGCHFCVPLIEILRDMMSQRRFNDRQVHCKTFNLLKEINLEKLVETHFRENQLSYFYTGGLLEYLSLLRKVIKYGIHQFEKSAFQDISYIVEIVNKILLPLVDSFFTAANVDNVYLICLESIKAINTFLDIRLIEEKSLLQECIVNICARLQTKVLLYIQIASKSNLLSGYNFVGAIISSNDKTNISVLTRQMIVLSLKTFCVTIKGGLNDRFNIDDLKCLWDEVGCCIINDAKGQPTTDWLPMAFADQDDQWIIALFCLLIIHKELKKRQSNDHECIMVDMKLTASSECSLKYLQHTVCPHRLFLQLASFIDYDHLVLADFLTSPETPFLSYFTQYLRAMSTDWQDFVSVCLKEKTDVKIGQSDSDKSNSHKHLRSEQEPVETAESVIMFSAVKTSPWSIDTLTQGAPHSNSLLPLQSIEEASILCSETVHNLAVLNSDVQPTEILKDQATFINDVHLTKTLIDQAMSNNGAHPAEMLTDQAMSNNGAHPAEMLTDQAMSNNGAHPAEILTDQAVSNNGADPAELLTDQAIYNPDAHLLEIMKDPLQCSIAPQGDSVFSITLSRDLLHSTTVIPYDQLLHSTPTSTTIVSTRPLTSNCLYNSPILCRDALHNSSTIQPLSQQEHKATQSHLHADKLSDQCGGNTDGRSLALVAYSDSENEDSENDMKTTKINLPATKQNIKRCLSSDSDSDTCDGYSTESYKNLISLHRCDGNGVCSSPFHESTSDIVIDKSNKCSNKLDNILGMLIRLRLHIERLDHSNLFPYNPKPLVLLLEACEELYEKPTGS